MKNLILLLALAASACPVLATQKTATLAVAGMTCAACPITVKKALTNINGVTPVDLDYNKRRVVVSYDDAKASLHQLTDATAQAGFVSTPRESKQ